MRKFIIKNRPDRTKKTLSVQYRTTLLLSALSIAFLSLGAFSANALPSSSENESSYENSVPESSYEFSETSSEETSYDESSYEESSYYENSYVESSYESSYYESSQEYISTESSYYSESSYSESSAESSVSESSAVQSSVEESSADESSAEESSREISDIFENDPFDWINRLETVLPADKEGYISPKQESDRLLAEESDKAVAAAILSTPPMPYDETSKKIITDTAESKMQTPSYILGIIIWIIIGIIVIATLIVITRSKGASSVSRQRYRKNSVIRKSGRKFYSKYKR